MLALAIQKLDGSERFGLQTHPHVKIWSKFEVLGPRNGRGATCQNASLVNSACALAVNYQVNCPQDSSTQVVIVTDNYWDIKKLVLRFLTS